MLFVLACVCQQLRHLSAPQPTPCLMSWKKRWTKTMPGRTTKWARPPTKCHLQTELVDIIRRRSICWQFGHIKFSIFNYWAAECKLHRYIKMCIHGDPSRERRCRGNAKCRLVSYLKMHSSTKTVFLTNNVIIAARCTATRVQGTLIRGIRSYRLWAKTWYTTSGGRSDTMKLYGKTTQRFFCYLDQLSQLEGGVVWILTWRTFWQFTIRYVPNSYFPKQFQMGD